MENKPHILCVDDDDEIRELLKSFFKKTILLFQLRQMQIPHTIYLNILFMI